MREWMQRMALRQAVGHIREASCSLRLDKEEANTSSKSTENQTGDMTSHDLQQLPVPNATSLLLTAFLRLEDASKADNSFSA